MDQIIAPGPVARVADGRAAGPSRKCRQVLDAAAELFMAHGYGAVSMDAIARAAGVSKATLYAYFASKDQLFATIIGQACLDNTLDDANFPTEVADVGAALASIGGRVIRFLLEPHTLAIYRVVIAEAARFPELGPAFIANGPQAFRDRLTAWFGAQDAAGRMVVPDPGLAADQFSALLRPAMFMRATLAVPPAPTEAEIDAWVAAAVRVFLAAYGPAPG